MAILKMKKITVFGLNRDRKQMLELLHQKELVEVSQVDREALGIGAQETAQHISRFDSSLASAGQALAVLDREAPEKQGLFYKRKKLGAERYSMAPAEYDAVLKDIYSIIRLAKQTKAHTEDIGKTQARIAGLQPYMKLDVPMNLRETVKTGIQLGTLEGFWEPAQIIAKMQEAGVEDGYAEVLSAMKERTYVWMLYPKKREQEFREFLRTVQFAEPPFHLSHDTPEKKTAALKEEQRRLEAERMRMQKELRAFVQRRPAIQLFYDHLVLRREKYEALARMGVTAHTFMLEGYMPEEFAPALQQELERRFQCAVQIEEPGADAPVAFHNHALAQPVEQITGDYSMPSPHDIDPNPIMAVFYYLFFGMMFSDAGYGLLLMLVCGFLGFGRLLEKGKRRMFRMFFFCGVSTTFWGIMYGSFFGDLIHSISATFGTGAMALQPVLLDPVAKPLELLILSVAFGMIHILTGLGIRFYMAWREGRYLDAVFDTGFWMLVLLGLSVLAAGMGLGNPVAGTVGKYMAIIGAAGLVLTQGRGKKNIVMKLFGGIISLYDITSYIGDILSYSRLMALGLATGVIASVVNVLASLGGGSAVGVVLFIVIALAGHLMNFAINMLGAYVHTNRLQYVEFYQKFYEGGGRRFQPFSMHTKYYDFSNE